MEIRRLFTNTSDEDCNSLFGFGNIYSSFLSFWGVEKCDNIDMHSRVCIIQVRGPLNRGKKYTVYYIYIIIWRPRSWEFSF